MRYQILFVDDEPLITEGLKYLINWKYLNCNIAGIAENGKEALNIVHSKNIDIIVTDLRMSNGDGLVFLEKLKIFSNIQSIVLSGYSDFDSVRKSFRLGIKNYLLKPIDIEEFKKTIKECIKNIHRFKTLPNLQFNFSKRKNTFHVRKMIQQIEIHYSEDISLKYLSSQWNLSASYLGQLFQTETKRIYSVYLTSFRMEKAKKFLSTSCLHIKDIARSVGYQDSRYFSRVFKKYTGKTPNFWRECNIPRNRTVSRLE